MWADEWVLQAPRSQFEGLATPPANDGWKAILPGANSRFATNPESPALPFRAEPNEQLSRAFAENVVLFFSSDRFEPPNWLNQRDLIGGLRLPSSDVIQHETQRRIFAKSLLKPTLEWVRGVALDQLLVDRTVLPVNMPTGQVVDTLLPTDGPSTRLLAACRSLLTSALGHEGVHCQLQMGGRTMSRLSAVLGIGETARLVPDLLGLSAGQSALFCLFANILRDFDLTGRPFESTEAVRGIVVIDEVDLHLHVAMQHTALPALIAMFPNVQFVITTHSPLFVTGMAERFGPDGYRLVELPTGRAVSSEAYSEFVSAFDVFAATRASRSGWSNRRRADKPVVLVEGNTDAAHLRTAWGKLFPLVDLPYLFVPCGGAETLRRMLESLGWYERRTVVGLFDNDRAGANQHNSLRNSGFSPGPRPEVLLGRGHAIHAAVLPVPPGREPFAPDKLDRRVLEVEHYYSDEVLGRHGLRGEGLYGSAVFEINSGAKARFAEAAVPDLPAGEFEAFRPLFALLGDLAGT